MNTLLNQLQKVDKRKIVIIRHGETALNVDDRIRAWSDVPLDPKGIEQAENLGKQLKDSGVDFLVSSDLTRTLQTSACISRESGIPIIATDMCLRPWNVGKYTAQPAEKVHATLMEYAIEKPEEQIPDGESFDSFKYRCLMGIISYLNHYPDKLIGFVAHHRNDRLLRGWVEAGTPDDFEIDFDHFSTKGILPGTFDVLELTSSYI